MALSRGSRGRPFGLGAFDKAAWDAYQAGLAHGIDSGPPGGTLEDPNGGVIHFDANGQQDYYSPPAAFAAGQPHDNIVEQNPSSTFYGWTEYEKDAYYAAQDPTTGGQISTDYLVQNTPTGKSPSAAVVAENLRQLLAFAASSAKIQAALAQLKTGAFRGAQQATFDATNAANIKANAQQILTGWLAYRQSLINAHEPGADQMPLMPPTSYTGTLDAALAQALRDLVAALPPVVVAPGPPPPPPPPPLPPVTTLLPPQTIVDVAPPAQQAGGSFLQVNQPISMTGDAPPSPVFVPSDRTGGGDLLPRGGAQLAAPDHGTLILAGLGIAGALYLFSRKRR